MMSWNILKLMMMKDEISRLKEILEKEDEEKK